MSRKKIKINGTITSDSNSFIYRWFGIQVASPNMVADALEEANGEPVDVYINSGGGSVFAGSEMYTLLKEYAGEVTVKITGVAASAASVIAMAANKTLISPTAQMMIHNASSGTEGDKHAHQRSTNMLHSVDEAITNAYRMKTGKSKDELLALMDAETWMNAQQALELGFADEIMFSEDTVDDISNSATPFVELPQQVIDKIRNELFKAGTQQPMNHVPNTKTAPEDGAEGSDEPMNLDELKAKHPDLYNEVLNHGVKQERERITQLNALAGAPGAGEIVAKAIANGLTAGEAAMEIVKASQERISNEGQKRMNDALSSGVNSVPTDEAPAEKPNQQAVYDAEAEALAAEIKALRGGK